MPAMPEMDPLYDVYYEKYLLLHSLYGTDRPQLTREQYQALDKELLSLVNVAQEKDLTMAQLARIKEVEHLLMDDVAEGFYS